MGAGTQTAALSTGGQIAGGSTVGSTEEWSGTGFITRSITTTTE